MGAELLIGLGMISASVLVHVGGLIVLLAWLKGRTSARARPNAYVEASSIFLVAVCGVFILHAIAIVGWGILYVAIGQLENLERGLYFSIVTYTTLGYGDIVLEPEWQLLSGIEAVNGVVLIGVSTAFLFAVLTHVFQRLAIIEPK